MVSDELQGLYMKIRITSEDRSHVITIRIVDQVLSEVPLDEPGVVELCRIRIIVVGGDLEEGPTSAIYGVVELGFGCVG